MINRFSWPRWTWLAIAGCFWILGALGLQAASQPQPEDPNSPSPLSSDGKLVQFERDIAPIFQERCLDCHGPNDAKNDFRIDDPESLADYIEPGDASSSSLYNDYLTAADEEMLMPPQSHKGPLSPAELALIRIWIDEGADWPEGAKVLEKSTNNVPAKTQPAPAGLLARLFAAQGFLHPATVHFPVALFLMGAGFLVLGWKWPALGTQIPLACLWLGSASSIAASVMGWAFATERGYGKWNRFDAEAMDGEIFWHRWSAVIVTILAVSFSIVALKALKTNSAKLTRIWKMGLVACALIVGAVGHQGGEMTYGKDFYPKMFRILRGTQP
jgi:Planctomycete cytochrome C